MARIIRGAAALLMLAVLAAGPACAETTKVTFLLVNDIYQMSAQVMPKGGHVIVAHAGDMISPSLMSGLDRGAHTIALSNRVGLDIFVPGNHEFDFGKAVFLQRMREAKFPVYAANLRGPDGQSLAGIKDRGIVSFDGVRIGLTGATYDDSARASTPEDLQFLPTVASQKAQAETLRREGADFVAAVVHADRAQDYELFGTRTVDLILSGHNHDLFVNYDERNAMVESSYDAHYLVAIDVAIEVRVRNGVRATTWWPQFRIIDTATVTPDPAVAAAVLP
jgi:2',3'-cyclic-nucleotide 2'-phosphodiesterase (5'-nucleotidase family)